MHVFLCIGRESKARELLALPWTNINAQYANGNTPLILAVQGTSQNQQIDHLIMLLITSFTLQETT